MKFDIILNGVNEFYPKLNNKIYYILKVDNSEKISWMSNFLLNFLKKVSQIPNNKYYIGIDFEFNKVSKGDRDVALMQINLEDDLSSDGYLFVLYPPELPNNDLQILIKLVSEPKIIKILHGAESLDIPYLFNQLLKTTKNIEGFCSNFYDTKYLCDYMHINNKTIGRCSIYYLLTENKIITDHKFEQLENIEKKTGPIYLIHINIHKMSHEVLKYSLYDVLFLPELIKKFIVKGKIYKTIIPEVSCIVNKYKRNIEIEFSKLERIISDLNICFIYEKTNKILLKEIWECYYYFLTDSNKYLENMREIHYFKNFFEIITKMTVYKNILKFYKVYKSRKEIIEGISFDLYFKWLSKYNELSKIFIEYDNLLFEDLIKITKTLN